MKLTTALMIAFTVHAGSAQVETYLKTDPFADCDRKCYALVRIPASFLQEVPNDTPTIARVNAESALWLRKSTGKETSIVHDEQLEKVKSCNSPFTIVKIMNYTRKNGSMGLAVGAVMVKFIHFENANNEKPTREIEIDGIGKALWGDVNVFISAYQNALKQYIDSLAPERFRLTPISKEP